MKKICFAALLSCVAPFEVSADVPGLSISSDRCAIQYALTLTQPAGCPQPEGPGALRAVTESPMDEMPAKKRMPKARVAKGYFIQFDFASDILGPDYQAHLTKLAGVLNSDDLQSLCIKLVGHTDSVGSKALNQKLSEKRAKSVQMFMTGPMKISATRVLTEGAGETQILPGVAGTDSRNRRVEILARHKVGDQCTL